MRCLLDVLQQESLVVCRSQCWGGHYQRCSGNKGPAVDELHHFRMPGSPASDTCHHAAGFGTSTDCVLDKNRILYPNFSVATRSHL
jgi:hypothetical protein